MVSINFSNSQVNNNWRGVKKLSRFGVGIGFGKILAWGL